MQRWLRLRYPSSRFDYNPPTAIQIYVNAYSGYRANERPSHFCVDEDLIDIAEVEDRWYDPSAEYFRVRSTGGKRYILRCSMDGEWTLQSGFDAAELFARPGIELVTVEPTTIRKAEIKIAGCERCRADESDIPFDWILADVMDKHGAFDFILSEPGHCPNCREELSEKTLVEPQGGIEVETMLGVR